MREDWDLKRLGDVCKYDKSQENHVNLPYVGLEDIESETTRFLGSLIPTSVKSKTFKFDTSHLLYGRLRPYLNKVLAPHFEGHCSTEIFPISPSDELDRNYLKYWFISDDVVRKIDSTSTGARMPRANMKEVTQFKIPIPSIPEQKRIVAILDEAFEAIDQAKANVEKNIQNAEELFQSKLNEIFTQKGKGWEAFTVKEMGELQTGTTPPTKDVSNYGNYIPFVKPAHFQNDGSIEYGESMLSEKGLENGRLIPEKSVLMVCIGASIGKTGYTDIEVSSNQQINIVTPKDKFEAKLIYYGMISRHFFNQVLLNASQTTLPIINKTKWSKLKLNLPIEKELQCKIVSNLDDIRFETISIIERYKSKLNALEELKKSTLQKAFSGELTAKETVAV